MSTAARSADTNAQLREVLAFLKRRGCFHLFDKTPHAWSKIDAWTKRPEEFVKRAGFALIASVALHDKKAAASANPRMSATSSRRA